MGIYYEYMIHRRANTSSQQTYERMLKFICREMQMKVKMRYILFIYVISSYIVEWKKLKRLVTQTIGRNIENRLFIYC